MTKANRWYDNISFNKYEIVKGIKICYLGSLKTLFGFTNKLIYLLSYLHVRSFSLNISTVVLKV